MADLNWEALYKRFTAPVCDFDCAHLCAPQNDGIPACCENDSCPPVVFTDELRWLRQQTDLWKKRRALSDEEKEEDAELERYVKYAVCKGPDQCIRRYRSLTCRFFPFEPYIDSDGIVRGLTWVYRCADTCPLIDHPEVPVNPRYVSQALAVWHALFIAYPDEYTLYCNESKALRKKFKKLKKKISVFQEKGGAILVSL